MTKERKVKVYDSFSLALLALMALLIYMVWDISGTFLPSWAQYGIVIWMIYKGLNAIREVK